MCANNVWWILGILSLELHLSCALISNLVIKNDGRSAFHIASFGYEPGGHFFLNVDNFLLMVPHDYQQPEEGEYNIAFVLQRSSSDGGLRLDDSGNDVCFHRNKLNEDDIIIALNERKMWPQTKFAEVIEVPGWYHVYFSNCEKSTQATFTLNLEEYNVEEGTRKKIYLGAGDASLPTWLTILCVVFVCEATAWGYILISRKNEVRKIHFVMVIVVIFKILSLFCESVQLHTVKYTGHPDGWKIVYYVVSSMKSLLFFSSVVLIGTGYGYLRWFLTDRDRQIMVAVLAVQVLVNIAMVVVDETSEGTAGWLTWRDALHLLDMVCCCAILLPIIWSIRHLRAAADVDGKVAKNMQKLKNFRTFYLMVVSYIYFTRIIVFLLSATLPFELTWLSRVFDEVAALIFYAMTGWLFRPQSSNPYFALNNKESSEEAPDPATAAIEMSQL